MHIALQRSGGLAGISLSASLDTEQLPPEEATRLHTALGRVDLAELASQADTGPGMADGFQYDLTFEQGGQSHQVSLAEPAVPEELRPVIDALMARASLGGPGA